MTTSTHEDAKSLLRQKIADGLRRCGSAKERLQMLAAFSDWTRRFEKWQRKHVPKLLKNGKTVEVANAIRLFDEELTRILKIEGTQQ